jgi:hypothetical protein
MNAGRFVSSYVADAREYSLDRRNICSAWHRTWRHFSCQCESGHLKHFEASPSDYTEYLGVHQSYLITYRFVPEGRLCQRALYGASIAHELGRRRKKGKGPGQLALQHRSSWILMPLVLWGGSEAVGADSVGSEKSCAGQSSDEGEGMT